MLREVIDLAGTYAALPHLLTEDQLAAQYRTATERGRRAGADPHEPERPISLLAAGVPVAANLDVAIHALHVIPPTAAAGVDLQLAQRIREDSAVALNLCERALELDGRSHGYRAVEWRPTVHDVANAITAAPRLDREPPSIVSCAHDTVDWLARAIADLDQDSPEAAAALAETLGRLLAISIFAEATLPATDDDAET